MDPDHKQYLLMVQISLAILGLFLALGLILSYL